ncbi:urease accessory protein [Povalibacter uvarum]|uniref:Urease accessory protein n=1 Tax=Povalibacter uvarum TaxID=732238 RepID=A0A841HN54_9GAMM|nr:HupE/UreJ family protein [Povalibacter uvarum]MBB6094183.1 urease accessory protein [Povalibacter uvarum]
MSSAWVRRAAGFGAGISVLLPALALAHPEGHGAQNAIDGFLHPLTGLDHLLAMIAVGLWAVHLGRRAVRILPIVFPVAMVVGALFALGGIALPAIEPAIAVSVIVLGVLVAAGVRMPVVAGAALIGVFAVFHGYAHATEGPSANMLAYAIGFVGATVALHAVGIVAGAWIARNDLQHSRVVNGLAGTAIALAGTAILII